MFWRFQNQFQFRKHAETVVATMKMSIALKSWWKTGENAGHRNKGDVCMWCQLPRHFYERVAVIRTGGTAIFSHFPGRTLIGMQRILLRYLLTETMKLDVFELQSLESCTAVKMFPKNCYDSFSIVIRFHSLMTAKTRTCCHFPG